MKILKKIQLKIVIFTAVKNRCILHGRVFVMFIQALMEVRIIWKYEKSETTEKTYSRFLDAQWQLTP